MSDLWRYVAVVGLTLSALLAVGTVEMILGWWVLPWVLWKERPHDE